MKDIIFIHQLKIETIIGVYPWERDKKQPVLIDVELAVNSQPAALSENLQDTVDYANIAARITEFVSASQFQLLETLAEKIATLIFTEFKTNWLKLQVAKPQAIVNAKQVGIVIERCLSTAVAIKKVKVSEFLEKDNCSPQYDAEPSAG